MKRIAYQLSTMYFYGFVTFTIFVFVFSILSFTENYFGWDIPFVEVSKKGVGNYVSIRIPLLNLIVEFYLKYVAFMLLTLLFYSVYSYALKNFFTLFVEEKVFQNKMYEKLNLFYRLNFIPIIIAIIGLVISYVQLKKIKMGEPHFILLIHLFVAFLVYLYRDIIKKGMLIQEENDLTI